MRSIIRLAAVLLTLSGVIVLPMDALSMSASSAQEAQTVQGVRQETEETEITQVWEPDPQHRTFTAMIVSDLHFTTREDAGDSIVAGIGYAREITDALIREVIESRPDALILTGDNTNGGGEEDVAGLCEKLESVREAGIQVVVTTGNHDLNHMDPAAFEEAYFPLLRPVNRDPASLSYTAFQDGVVLLVMDDGAVQPGGSGCFSRETMDWLKDMLKKYKAYPMVFISHHNVLLGKGSEDSANYRIQNEDLAGLLAGYGVRLALTGHFHAQIILEQQGLYEIVGGMPYGSGHLIGRLQIDRDGSILYEAKGIDLEGYGAGEIVEELAGKEARNEGLTARSFTRIVEKAGLTKQEQEDVLSLTGRFIRYYTEGTMAEHLEEIQNDPACSKMIEALWDDNYGPWMQSVLDSRPLPARRLYLPGG